MPVQLLHLRLRDRFSGDKGSELLSQAAVCGEEAGVGLGERGVKEGAGKCAVVWYL